MKLSAVGLVKRYGDQPVLDGLDFHADAGEFVGIVGPSGCGKSTLLAILASLDLPDAGTLHYDGHDALRMHEHELSRWRNRRFGFVFQSSHLLMHLGVLQNVMLPFCYGPHQNDAEIRARQALQSVGLGDAATRTAALLSGGEQQRAALARALVNDPAVIFADEPTGNLDAENSRRVLEQLCRICQAGKTVIMVTHDPMAVKHCSRVLTLRKL